MASEGRCAARRLCDFRCLGSHHLRKCNACRRQASLFAGTIFAATTLPLTIWLLAIYLRTQSKHGVSSLEKVKQSLAGTGHELAGKRLPRYLAEFRYRNDLEASVLRLVRAAS